MKHYKNNIDVNILVLFIAAIYFLVATSHIFLLKNRTRADKRAHVHTNITVSKKIGLSYSKVDDVSLIKLIDKTTVESKKTFNDLIKITAEFFLITLFVSATWLLKPRSFNTRQSGQLINYQDYYLSICALRI
ncbi:MAG TPA: hypothetical protein VIM89_15480 [Mucilaginibacter sp.]